MYHLDKYKSLKTTNETTYKTIEITLDHLKILNTLQNKMINFTKYYFFQEI